MLKTILVAVDGSDHSLRAVDMAANIAACSGARLVLLYVVKSQELPASLRRFAEAEHIAGPDTEVLHRAAEFVLADAGDRARAQGIDDPQREVVEGPPARTIARVIARAISTYFERDLHQKQWALAAQDPRFQ